MNYKRIYDSLIEKAKAREGVSEYLETHHIIPKCLGGTDESNNLVDLTPEEHYVAHQLLSRIYPDHPGLLYAAVMMCANRPSNKMYGWLRRRFSAAQSLKMKDGGSPTCGKRWISNEHETVLVDELSARDAISKGTHIAGKIAIRASCGHLVRERCISCDNKKKESYDKKNLRTKQMAQDLFEEFKSSGTPSVCEFAKMKQTSQPRLTMLWKKYVPEYNSRKQHGKSFNQ